MIPIMSEGARPEQPDHVAQSCPHDVGSLVGLSPHSLPEWRPGVFAARFRAELIGGFVLPCGRRLGEIDRVVHLFPMPTGPKIPSDLTAFCHLTVRPRQAELVAVGEGMPCMVCLIAANGI
jgi:hypothetical protein